MQKQLCENGISQYCMPASTLLYRHFDNTQKTPLNDVGTNNGQKQTPWNVYYIYDFIIKYSLHECE